MGDYVDYPKLRLAHSHLLLKLTHPIHYLSFGKLGLAETTNYNGGLKGTAQITFSLVFSLVSQQCLEFVSRQASVSNQSSQ